MGKLIDADDFYESLLEYAITDKDRQFAEEVKYALDKQEAVQKDPLIVIEYDPENADSFKCAINAGRKEGRAELWSAIKKVKTEYPQKDMIKLLNPGGISIELFKNSPQRIIDKIKYYEDQKKKEKAITVGDEIISSEGERGVAVRILDDIVFIVTAYGRERAHPIEHIAKTGRHFDIQSIFDAMKEPSQCTSK